MAKSVRDLQDDELFERVAGVPPPRVERLGQRQDPATWARWDEEAWKVVPGVGDVRAARMEACFELGRRAWAAHAHVRPRIGSPEDVWWHVRHLGNARQERLLGLYLDSQHGLLRTELLSVGALNVTRTPPRDVLCPAIRLPAAGLILAHNHPSGCSNPSADDWEFTSAIRRAARSMGLALYDHLIVVGSGYISLRERPQWAELSC